MLTVAELNGSRLYREAAAIAHEASPDSRRSRDALSDRHPHDRVMATDLVTNIDRELERARNRQRRGGAASGQGARSVQSPASAAQVDELKQIMRDRLYRHYRVSRMTEKAGRVLARLFETYMAAPRQIPAHVLARVERRWRAAGARGCRLYRRDD